MKNYINVRVQSYNHKRQYDMLRHNFRHKKDSLSQTNEKPNFLIDPANGKLIQIDNGNKKKIYDAFSKKYQKNRLKHNEIYKAKHKRNLRDFQSSWMEGVLTFSEAIHQDLGTKYSKEDLVRVATNCVNDIAKKYNTKINYLILHLDETTPHFHFSLKNHDEIGLSLWKKNQNREFLSQLQDLAFEHFKEFDMKRGEYKDITNRRYETIQKYHARKEVELKDKTLLLEQQYNNKKIELEKDLKALYFEVNSQKNEALALRKNYDRDSQEYKDLTIAIKQLRDEEQTLRQKVRELKEVDNLGDYFKKLQKDIKEIMNSNINEVVPLVGKNRFEVENRDKMYKELVLKLKELLSVEIVEVSSLKNENKDLQSKLDDKTTLLSEVITERNQERQANKTLEQKNKSLEARINVLEQDNISKTSEITKLEQKHTLELKTLKNDFKPFIKLKNSNIANRVRENIRAKQLSRENNIQEFER